MAIKAKIKPLLPPTERTFSAKISSLENQLGIMESRIIELERLCNAQAQSLDAYTRLTAELLQLVFTATLSTLIPIAVGTSLLRAGMVPITLAMSL